MVYKFLQGYCLQSHRVHADKAQELFVRTMLVFVFGGKENKTAAQRIITDDKRQNLCYNMKRMSDKIVA